MKKRYSPTNESADGHIIVGSTQVLSADSLIISIIRGQDRICSAVNGTTVPRRGWHYPLETGYVSP